MTEDQIVGGAIPDEPDERDFVFGATKPFPFWIEFDIEMLLGFRATCKDQDEFFGEYGRAGWCVDRYLEIKKICKEKEIKPFKIPPKNQGTQMSCTGQASSQYLSVLNFIETGVWVEFSAHDIYAAINLGEGKGAKLRDAMNRCVDPGVATEELVPSYESFMTDHGLVRNPLSEHQVCQKPEETDEIKKIRKIMASKEYRTVTKQSTEMMDAVAWAIFEGFGCFFGVVGESNGTWMSEYPQPPKKNAWGHALYAGKCGIKNGKPYIEHINSWGNGTGIDGWQKLDATYFLTIVEGRNAVFNPWTLIDKKNESMTNSNVVIVKDANGSAVGAFIKFKDEAAVKPVCDTLGKEVPYNADGTINWSAFIENEASFKKPL